MNSIEIIKNKLKQLERNNTINEQTIAEAKLLYIEGACQMMSRSKLKFEFVISMFDRNLEFDIEINSETNEVYALQNRIEYSWDKYVVACLYQLIDELNIGFDKMEGKGIKYTREGMMKRVMEERKQRALIADYEIEFADNIYGEHTLTNEQGKKYKITLRDFEHEIGYIDNIDLRTNKLGTTKHIMWLFDKLKREPELMNGLETQYPFVEIYLDPLNEYKITWFYPHSMRKEVNDLIKKYFGQSHIYPDKQIEKFDSFVEEASQFDEIKIRPDVIEKVQTAVENAHLNKLRECSTIDFNQLKKHPYPFQQDGIRFATFRQGAIIADEFGLGKTLQAIGAALAKRDLLGFKKTLVVCPTSYKNDWLREITESCDASAKVAEGSSENRANIYRDNETFFVIAAYETIVADYEKISDYVFDFIILDETQKIKNYQSKTTNTIKNLKKRHALALTDSPIEDKLIDLFSIVGFIDPYFLTPLWEFSYQHCLFDPIEKDKIVGYYNLSQLKNRIQTVMLRRDKQEVLKQLPNINEINVPIKMHPVQLQYYGRFAFNLRQLLQKKIVAQTDLRKIMHQLNNLRMVCDSTGLIDNTNYSPKIAELKHILTEKIPFNSTTRVVIYSEWQTMLNLIATMLKKENLSFIEINKNLSNESKGKLLTRFFSGSSHILLATDDMSKEISEQRLDYVINVEIPWNVENRNNRIGKINRIATANTCTIINLINIQTIETSILMGKFQRHEVFSEIFNSNSQVDFIDVENPGISQIIKELNEIVSTNSTIDEFAFSCDDSIDNVVGNEEELPFTKTEKTASIDRGNYIEMFNRALENFYNSYRSIVGNEFEFSNHSIEFDEANEQFVIKVKRK